MKLAQKKTATLEAASNSVRITIGLITTLLVGYLSDRYGRRAAFGILLVGEVLHVSVADPMVIMILSMVLLGSVSALADLQYVAVYLMGPPFLWSPETVGLYS
ncbi:unnamed protein product [Schistosoma margrebowiei]|uniref:Uncharacterized protein n=1 Tax=Schistosoma margrebowiei TaxID=48269 RepID=A0A3P8EA00_9TREM|nr:unnamed protein product [Schistosoma margrebowiei]